VLSNAAMPRRLMGSDTATAAGMHKGALPAMTLSHRALWLLTHLSSDQRCLCCCLMLLGS
jgi:hypothetical protein